MKRLLPFVALLVTLLAGIISFVVVLNPERHRTEIADLLAKLLKRPVVIGQLSMGYLPPTLRLGQVAVMKEGGNPALEIVETSVALNVGALLQLKFKPSSLRFTHWKLMISRKANGHWDLEDWFSGLSSGQSGREAYPVTSAGGEIHWQDSYANPPQEIMLGSISGTWDPAKSAVSASGDFVGLGSPAHLAYAGSAEGTGDIQLAHGSDSCAIHLENKSDSQVVKGTSAQWPLDNALTFVKFYGRAAAKNVDSAKGLELRNWQFHVTRTSSQMAFEHTAGVSGGLSEAKGTITSGPSGLTARLQSAVKDVPAGAFQAVVGEDLSLSGQVTAVAKDLQIALSSATTLVSGQGYWELKAGSYLIPAVSLKKLARAKTMPYLKSKFTDLETNGIPIQRLSAHWQVKDGLIAIEDGLLVSSTIKAGVIGKVDASKRGMDATIRLEFREKDPKLLNLIPARYHTQPAYGRVQGTWQEWFLRSLPASKIPSSMQARLRKAVNQK